MGGEKNATTLLMALEGHAESSGGERAQQGSHQPLEISKLGCADGCGRRGCKGVAGNG